MQYSYWSGQIKGIEEKLVENFSKNPNFMNAMQNLVFVMKVRNDFRYFKRNGMIDGDLPPFDRKLIKNLVIGAKNSIKSRIDIEIV